MLTKFCSIFILCILCLITPLYALHCYECEDCLSHDAEFEKCDENQDACIKVTIGELVSKSCINSNFCTTEKFEEGLNQAWRKLKNIFVNDQDDTVRKKAFTCCHSDYCNSGNRLGNVVGSLGASFFLVGLTYLLN